MDFFKGLKYSLLPSVALWVILILMAKIVFSWI